MAPYGSQCSLTLCPNLMRTQLDNDLKHTIKTIKLLNASVWQSESFLVLAGHFTCQNQIKEDAETTMKWKWLYQCMLRRTCWCLWVVDIHPQIVLHTRLIQPHTTNVCHCPK